MICAADSLKAAGMSAGAAGGKQTLFDSLEAVADLRGWPRDERVAWFVPGRIEVLGKHTDYAGGRSVLAAVERGFGLLASRRDDTRVLLTDIGRGQSAVAALDPELPGPTVGWANYAATVTRRLARNFPASRRGANILFTADMPSSAGMSSSSALMVGLFLTLAELNALEDHEIFSTRERLAGYLAAVENGENFCSLVGDRGVGTAGGSEDHTAILCCEPGRVSQYAFCPVRRERVADLDPDWVFAIGVSGSVASKTGAAGGRYNAAAFAARRLVEIWRADTGRSDAVLADALRTAPDAADRLRAAIRTAESGLTRHRLLGRLEQFVEECETIVPAAGERLAAGDIAALGPLVDRSQALAEQYLDNQVPETIALARSARSLGAAAASAFGAGYGGSVWALVQRGTAGAFLERWAQEYTTAFRGNAQRSAFFATRPGPAALRLHRQ